MKNILIIGGGGREHALGLALSRSSEAPFLTFAPGNAGTRRLPQAQNRAIGAEDVAALVEYARVERPDLVVVGPEVPLAAGLADSLRAMNIAVFGPGAAGARLEASKSWAKEFMGRHGIPTAAVATFRQSESAAALAHLRTQPGPYVIKADGLAAGKGVLVTADQAAAAEFVRETLSGGLFGEAGNRVLIEEFMQGVEVSVLAMCDTVSGRIIALEPASDYKRAYDGDDGPNTGGMGAYSPPGFMTAEVRQEIQERILEPTLAGLRAEGIDYRGTVYAGLMLTATGPRVVEYNCRLGDPETQSLVPRLASDLLELLEATSAGRLREIAPPRWKDGASVGVVLAAGGYPGPYERGAVVRGLEAFDGLEDIWLFHAGTTLDAAGQTVTAGGRVFNLVATGPDIATARQRVYNILGEGRIGFAGMRYRSDIAAREILRAEF